MPSANPTRKPQYEGLSDFITTPILKKLKRPMGYGFGGGSLTGMLSVQANAVFDGAYSQKGLFLPIGDAVLAFFLLKAIEERMAPSIQDHELVVHFRTVYHTCRYFCSHIHPS